ncbi:MAG: glycosyltransferase [Myxococcota bacterium]
MPALLLALYVVLVGLCAAHGAHRLVLLASYLRNRGKVPVAPPWAGPLPFVTVQLPVYNERDVVARVIDAAAALDWPADRLEIQLLDDSTDDTGLVALPAVDRALARGLDVRVLRRADRAGFKAGALAAGLQEARGELIAVFDADFVPAPDFLRTLVPHFADPGVGMVQACWGHLNADASVLTRTEAALLDGHFVIEHTARCRGGRWFNFNGTAGVWRRACIDAAGGWQHDTLTEDLDLSYRAQVAGWRFVYMLEHVSPAELPASLAAFRGQQRRWAKGSVEVARKLVPSILHADAPLATRLEALAHLTANLAWPVSLLLALVLPALVIVRGTAPGAWLYLPAFVFSTGVHALFYLVAARRVSVIPLTTLLGIGMTVHQTFAVVEALTGRRTAFVRTPKAGAGGGSYAAADRLDPAVPIEVGLMVVHLGTAVWAAVQGVWGAVPFLLLFGGGFAWTGLGSLLEARKVHVRRFDTALGAPVGGR